MENAVFVVSKGESSDAWIKVENPKRAVLGNLSKSLAAQQLHAVYGINVDWKKLTKRTKSKSSNKVKVFGRPLESLPQYNTEHGAVPRFLVDACTTLLEHVDTEGLFRKASAIAARKALRVKLDAGEQCLSTAKPHLVADLVKQFFRELPEAVLPTKLQEAFLKAQQLTSQADRTAATLLLSCLLPDRNLSVLSYLFDFLHSVSKRSAENLMDSFNLSVVLTPNILPSGEGSENMATTEQRLKLQTAVIQCYIENSQDFGVLPLFLMKTVPAALGSEASNLLPAQDSGKCKETDLLLQREERTPEQREERTCKKRLARIASWIQARIFGIHKACSSCVSHQEIARSAHPWPEQYEQWLQFQRQQD